MTRRALAFSCALIVAGCGSDPVATPRQMPEEWLYVPADFPPMPLPEDNALTRERALLGKRLFFDVRLSRTSDVSCSTCHLQENAFSDPKRFSVGVEGRLGMRNAPALVNQAWSTSYFWDGGVPTLELQAIAPIQNPLEMDLPLVDGAERLAHDAELVSAFETAYGAGPSEYTVTRAIASFVRTLVSGDSPYDRLRRGDESALTPLEREGYDIFSGERGECFHCHAGLDLTIGEFRNNGIAADDPDLGRATITHRDIDAGKFKIPTLRNVALTAPYMHGGSLATLEEVVDHYNDGGRGHANTDAAIHPLGLTTDEKSALVAFLGSLTDPAFLDAERFRPESRMPGSR